VLAVSLVVVVLIVDLLLAGSNKGRRSLKTTVLIGP
jgi:hypothetical protein